MYCSSYLRGNIPGTIPINMGIFPGPFLEHKTRIFLSPEIKVLGPGARNGSEKQRKAMPNRSLRLGNAIVGAKTESRETTKRPNTGFLKQRNDMILGRRNPTILNCFVHYIKFPKNKIIFLTERHSCLIFRFVKAMGVLTTTN